MTTAKEKLIIAIKAGKSILAPYGAVYRLFVDKDAVLESCLVYYNGEKDTTHRLYSSFEQIFEGFTKKLSLELSEGTITQEEFDIRSARWEILEDGDPRIISRKEGEKS